MTLNKINDERAFFETLAERSLLKTLDGSCRSPISASAHFTDSKELILYGAIATLDGTKVIRSKIKGSIKDAIKLGKELGNKIKAQKYIFKNKGRSYLQKTIVKKSIVLLKNMI